MYSLIVTNKLNNNNYNTINVIIYIIQFMYNINCNYIGSY